MPPVRDRTAPVIDKDQVKADRRGGPPSDPERGNGPESIVRLAEEVVRVSLETMEVIRGSPSA